MEFKLTKEELLNRIITFKKNIDEIKVEISRFEGLAARFKNEGNKLKVKIMKQNIKSAKVELEKEMKKLMDAIDYLDKGFYI